MSTLYDVTIAVTSFLRHGYVAKCIHSIREFLPECAVIIADDSGEPEPAVRYRWKGFQHNGIILPFDSGLSAKRNAIVRECSTKYLLLFCDDFKADQQCRLGVERMVEVLDRWPEIQVAAGRVDKRPYEAWLEYIPGHLIKERPIEFEYDANEPHTGLAIPPFPIELASNYFLGRTEALQGCPWPEDIRPIGGEHVAFFLDAKIQGMRIVLVTGANVNTMTLGPEAQDPRYPAMRARAASTGHAAMKAHYNIRRYIGMNGDVS